MKGLAFGLFVALTLLGCGSSVHYTGKPDFDLRLAAMSGDLSKINELLDKGVDINACSAAGNSALHNAADEGQIEAVKLLVKRGATIDLQSGSGATPLLHAVMNKQEETAKLLVKLGAKTDIVDANGKTVQEFADILGVRLR